MSSLHNLVKRGIEVRFDQLSSFHIKFIIGISHKGNAVHDLVQDLTDISGFTSLKVFHQLVPQN